MCGHVVFCSKDLTNVNSLLFMQHNTEVRGFHNESGGRGGGGVKRITGGLTGNTKYEKKISTGNMTGLTVGKNTHSRFWSVYMNEKKDTLRCIITYKVTHRIH
jgi:hypothetical protein